MNRWWSEDRDYINVFDWNHFLYIGIAFVILAALILCRKQVKIHSDFLVKAILVISILQQLMLYAWYVFETGFNISESLPLHISRLSSILGIIFLVTKNIKWVDVLFYFGLYAYAAFLYPSRIYPIDHVIGISYLVNHIITFILPIFAYIAYNWRPSFKALLTSYGYFLLYFTLVYFLNPLIDGNYFYLKYRPFFNDWPEYKYIPGVLIITLVLYFVGYFILKLVGKIKSK